VCDSYVPVSLLDETTTCYVYHSCSRPGLLSSLARRGPGRSLFRGVPTTSHAPTPPKEVLLFSTILAFASEIVLFLVQYVRGGRLGSLGGNVLRARRKGPRGRQVRIFADYSTVIVPTADNDSLCFF